MRVTSLSAKVFAAFLVVMATFGGVTAYGAHAMRRLGDELRRISRGYLQLRLDLHDLETRQSNLLQVMERPDDQQRAPGFVKSAVDGARAFRKKSVRSAEELVEKLGAEAPARGERAFLDDVGQRLRGIEQTFLDDEPLFDRIYGPPFAKPLAEALPGEVAAAREKLLHREERIWKKDLGDLNSALRGRVAEAEATLERDEERAVYATVALALIAALIGLGVILAVQRALAPLRRLAAGARTLARGDLSQRVEAASSDEIGQLAREFNAMAAALEEREQRLIRSERLAAVGRIAAQITHEVRNPLSSIGLNAELLEEEVPSGSEARELVRAIIKEVDRLTEITEQYLRFTRLPRPKLEREDANSIASSLLAFLREELLARKIAIEARLDPALPLVAADENQLRQALLNLLRNAAEAMPGGGRLTLATSFGGGMVRVSVTDTGEGIAADNVAKIFDPFFSTKEGGTGLGLALTQQIVVDHGGTIDVTSEPGRGTTFTVRLPALPGEAAPASPPADGEAVAPARGPA